ncbi:MAG: hypothetical protein DHS20C03_34490 [Minwuia thermotolerans]|nr:MAG: hypothetical protein DHS20C03_34490 [Minwuia thermotolerans]
MFVGRASPLPDCLLTPACPLPLPITHGIILMGGREGERAGAAHKHLQTVSRQTRTAHRKSRL